MLTKVLQRGRLAAYLEQSTRYIAYDRELPSGRYRYYWDERSGRPTRGDGAIFDLYSEGLERLREWCRRAVPAGEEPEAVWKRSIKAKALDAMRGLLPAASLSHVGIFAIGPGLRAARDAAARLAAARGARVRGHGAG